MKFKDITESSQQCPHCGGPMFSEMMMMEKKDACYYKVKSSAKVWPSAYASGRLVQCRKKGAANYGNKSKNEGVAEGETDLNWLRDMSKEKLDALAGPRYKKQSGTGGTDPKKKKASPSACHRPKHMLWAKRVVRQQRLANVVKIPIPTAAARP